MRRAARALGLVTFYGVLFAQRGPSVTSADHRVVQPVLIAPGSKPFHLDAVVLDGQQTIGTIEWLWIDPTHYRRFIRSAEFSQDLIVNGDRTLEKNSGDYLPLKWNTFAMAVVDSSFITNTIRDGDRLETKANKLADASGIKCFDQARKMCIRYPDGLHEIVAASGHGVEFSDYQNFRGTLVARTITNAARLGEKRLDLHVVGLEDLKNPKP
ncbi:hypothetical protein AB4043_24325, partial [Terriglobus sp. YAF25]